MNKLSIVLGAAFFLAAVCSSTCYGAAELTSYKVSITYSDEHSAEVSASFSVAGTLGSSAAARLILYPGQRIESAFPNMAPLDTGPAGAGGTTLQVPASSSGTFSLRYRLESAGELTHVPLPVPTAAPATREHFVQVDVILPDGMAVYDDQFPQKTWTDVTHGSTQLPAVPSVVSLRFAPADQVSWLTKWKSVSRLSSLSMLVILAGGSVLLYWLKRPSARRPERSV
jgi:hypothetical protein